MLTAALVMSVVECRISLKTRALTIIITIVVFAGGLILARSAYGQQQIPVV